METTEQERRAGGTAIKNALMQAFEQLLSDEAVQRLIADDDGKADLAELWARIADAARIEERRQYRKK